MTLEQYFTALIARVESSDIQNDGKDKGGFFEPTRAVLVQRLSLLRDLHAKPGAKAMVKSSWQYVVEHLPPEWLSVPEELKPQLKAILQKS